MIDFCHPVMWSFFTLPQIAIGCCFIHTRYNRHKGDIMNNAIMRVVLTGRKKKNQESQSLKWRISVGCYWPRELVPWNKNLEFITEVLDQTKLEFLKVA